MKRLATSSALAAMAFVLILGLIAGALYLSGRKSQAELAASPEEEAVVIARVNAFWHGYNEDPATKADAMYNPEYYLGGAFRVYLHSKEADERKQAFGVLLMGVLPYLKDAERNAIAKSIAGDDPEARGTVIQAMVRREADVSLLLLVVMTDEDRMAQALAGEHVDPVGAESE